MATAPGEEEEEDGEWSEELLSELLQLELPELTEEEKRLLDSIFPEQQQQQPAAPNYPDPSLQELFQLPNIDLTFIPKSEAIPGSVLPEEVVGRLVPSGSTVELCGQQVPVLLPVGCCSQLEEETEGRDILIASHPLASRLLLSSEEDWSWGLVECGVQEVDRVMQAAVTTATEITRDKHICGVMDKIDRESESILGGVSLFCKSLLDGCSGNTNKENSKDHANTEPATKKRISRQATQILRSWLFEHALKPYPDDDEKDKLCLQTGLSMTQVNNWFVNARRRTLPALLKQTASNM